MVRLLTLLFIANTAYIAAHATASIFYMLNVVMHVALGFAVTAMLRQRLRGIAAALMAAATVSGIYLTISGAVTKNYWILMAHIAAGVLGLLAFTRIADPAWRRSLATVMALGLAYFGGVYAYNRIFPDPHDRIRNPKIVPVSMEEEGAGPKSPFWPSSANTNVNGTIPSNFFMDSKLCGECHKDIYEQWNSSVHHFASFNNQFYRKSIEQMQELGGQKGSKWCAGCHDHAVFFNGRFDKPIKDQIDTPEAQNGLGCVSCHSITHVDGSMGNGGFTIEYPPLHDLMSSRNPIIRNIDYYLTYLEPEPHRRTFLKPFMRMDSAEYCSTCHKVHLDVPVNNYRWLRGFNDYDNWQASGVSGQGARSFYYPQSSSTCSDCHMPMVASQDPGNRAGKVHSHRFAVANTAVAHANRDATQLDETKKFLQSGFITVDIFGASPIGDNPRELQMQRRAAEGPQLMSTFAVGEEAEQGGEVFLREVGKLAAPLGRVQTKFKRGQPLRLDVVVRTRKIGHFFPGGTVDSFDIWLEVEAHDASGKMIFHSGAVEDGGKGPVERGAHFYRSYMLDGEGNPINKRNAWQGRSVLYVRMIPPGAADVAHYRLNVPKDAKGPIQVSAKLHYRKFSHYYTQYVYAGKPVGGEASTTHDSRQYSFDKANIPANVSGAIKGEIPDLPIITLASSKAEIDVGDAAPEWKPVVDKRDRERWNDWGIGLLLQGDLKAAEFAFQRVTEAEPEYADGWLNVGRALIQEGQIEAAKRYIENAMKRNAKLGRIHFFKAMAQKADGDYDGALASLREVTAQYPRDRVVLNQIGRVLFLRRDYKAAAEALERVLAVDPEDVQAHYNLMLVCRGLGDTARAEREEKLFRRFKADESSQTITAKPRLLSREDNNERQPIHDHESVPVGGGSK
ncbi:MAG: tetratricopeptide repeat protein [Bryobacteraceae bacterium]